MMTLFADNEDAKFLTATVRCLLRPIFLALCGDLSGESWITHLGTLMSCVSSKLAAVSDSDSSPWS